MSAIRPDLAGIPSQAITPRIAPGGDVRAAFFRAALDQVQGGPPAVVRTPVGSGEPPRGEDAVGRSLRPGSLLDIRV